MLQNVFQQFILMPAFFIPGFLLSLILFPKTDIIKRTTYSIVLSSSIGILTGAFLYSLNTLNETSILSIYIILIASLYLPISKHKSTYQTYFNKDFFYLLFFSTIGLTWRAWFCQSVSNPSDAYGYAFKFIGKMVPHLGFYTGMAADKSSYIGMKASNIIFSSFSLNNGFIQSFLMIFILLGFIYIIFNSFRNKALSYLGVALMALSPIELFHMTNAIHGHSLSYITLFPLLLLFKNEKKGHFWLSLLLSAAMLVTYYTASVVMLLASIGFIAAIILNDWIKDKHLFPPIHKCLKNKTIWSFAVISLVLFLHIHFLSQMSVYSYGRLKDLSDMPAISTISTIYQNPSFWGLSAIRWQMTFFFLCGLSFILQLIHKRKFSKENTDLLLCLIPIGIISYGFIHVNLPTRIFNYFAFEIIADPIRSLNFSV